MGSTSHNGRRGDMYLPSWLGAFAAVLLWGLFMFPSTAAQTCSALGPLLQAPITVTWPASTCYQAAPTSGPLMLSSGVFVLDGPAGLSEDALPSLDLNWGLSLVSAQSGADVSFALRNVQLLNVLLYPATSASPAWPAAFQPLIGDVASGGAAINLTISNSIIRTSCDTLNSYADAAVAGGLGNAITRTGAQVLTIGSLIRGRLSVTNSKLTCADNNNVLGATMPVTTSADLQRGFTAAAQVEAPTVVQLVRSVSVAGALATWPVPGIQLPASMLRLTVQGPATDVGVLDLRMAGSGVLVQPAAGVLLKLKDVQLQNVCTKQLSVVDGTGSVHIPMATPLWSMSATAGAMVPNTRALLASATVTVTSTELSLLTYWSMLLSSTLPGLSSYYRQGIMSALLGFVASNPQSSAPVVKAITPTSITFSTLTTGYVRGDDLTVTSQLPQLTSSSRAGFSALPATDCDTGLVITSAALQGAAALAPIWPVADSRGLLDSLQQAAQVTKVSAPSSYVPPMLVVTSDTAVPDDLNSFAIDINNDLILAGSPAASTNPVALDLRSQKSGLANTGASRVLIDGLWLRNLATSMPGTSITRRRLAGMSDAEGASVRRAMQQSTLSIALPLWFFDDHLSTRNGSVVLDKAVIDLPVIEYGLLYAAALRGSNWRATSIVNNAAATLLSNVQRFQVASAPTSTQISLSQYEGWGVLATDLIIKPNGLFNPGNLAPGLLPQALPPSLPPSPLRAPPPPPPVAMSPAPLPPPSPPQAVVLEDPKSSSNSGLVTAVGVLAGVIGLLLVALVVLSILFMRRQRTQEAEKNKAVVELQQAVNRLAIMPGSNIPIGSLPYPQSITPTHASPEVIHHHGQGGEHQAMISNRTSHISMDVHSQMQGHAPVSGMTGTSGATGTAIEHNAILFYVPSSAIGSGQHGYDKHRLAVASSGVDVPTELQQVLQQLTHLQSQQASNTGGQAMASSGTTTPQPNSQHLPQHQQLAHAAMSARAVLGGGRAGSTGTPVHSSVGMYVVSTGLTPPRSATAMNAPGSTAMSTHSAHSVPGSVSSSHRPSPTQGMHPLRQTPAGDGAHEHSGQPREASPETSGQWSTHMLQGESPDASHQRQGGGSLSGRQAQDTMWDGGGVESHSRRSSTSNVQHVATQRPHSAGHFVQTSPVQRPNSAQPMSRLPENSPVPGKVAKVAQTGSPPGHASAVHHDPSRLSSPASNTPAQVQFSVSSPGGQPQQYLSPQQSPSLPPPPQQPLSQAQLKPRQSLLQQRQSQGQVGDPNMSAELERESATLSARRQQQERAAAELAAQQARQAAARDALRELEQLKEDGDEAIVHALKEPVAGAPPHGGETAAKTSDDRSSKGGGAIKKRPSREQKDEAAEEWDPNKEVAQLAQELQGHDTAKLTLIDLIGQGAHGSVYRGIWRNLEVAVKTVMFSDRTGQGAGTNAKNSPKKRAIMEAAVCTSMMHPNVVCTYYYDITPIREDSAKGANPQVSRLLVENAMVTKDYKLYLVQEYCDASLHAVLGAHILHDPVSRQPNMDLVLTVLLDIARGMMYIHAKNIIHGDLKPENVLLKNDASSPIGVVGKVTDFGLSTLMDPGATHLSNMANGTPFYSAPEVVQAGQVTRASDVYSFGVLMWETYRCMPPWVRTKSGYTANPRFRRFPESSPLPFVLLCARCLDKAPKSRPVFQDIIKALTEMHGALLAGYPSLVRPTARALGLQGASALALMASATASATAAVGMAPESVGGQAKGWYHGMPSVADMPPVETAASMRLAGPPLAAMEKHQAHAQPPQVQRQQQQQQQQQQVQKQQQPTSDRPSAKKQAIAGAADTPIPAQLASTSAAAAGAAPAPLSATARAASVQPAAAATEPVAAAATTAAASAAAAAASAAADQALSQAALAQHDSSHKESTSAAEGPVSSLRSDALVRWLQQSDMPAEAKALALEQQGAAAAAAAKATAAALSATPSSHLGRAEKKSTHAAPAFYGSEQHFHGQMEVQGDADADAEVLSRMGLMHTSAAPSSPPQQQATRAPTAPAYQTAPPGGGTLQPQRSGSGGGAHPSSSRTGVHSGRAPSPSKLATSRVMSLAGAGSDSSAAPSSTPGSLSVAQRSIAMQQQGGSNSNSMAATIPSVAVDSVGTGFTGGTSSYTLASGFTGNTGTTGPDTSDRPSAGTDGRNSAASRAISDFLMQHGGGVVSADPSMYTDMGYDEPADLDERTSAGAGVAGTSRTSVSGGLSRTPTMDRGSTQADPLRQLSGRAAELSEATTAAGATAEAAAAPWHDEITFQAHNPGASTSSLTAGQAVGGPSAQLATLSGPSPASPGKPKSMVTSVSTLRATGAAATAPGSLSSGTTSVASLMVGQEQTIATGSPGRPLLSPSVQLGSYSPRPRSGSGSGTAPHAALSAARASAVDKANGLLGEEAFGRLSQLASSHSLSRRTAHASVDGPRVRGSQAGSQADEGCGSFARPIHTAVAGVLALGTSTLPRSSSQSGAVTSGLPAAGSPRSPLVARMEQKQSGELRGSGSGAASLTPVKVWTNEIFDEPRAS